MLRAPLTYIRGGLRSENTEIPKISNTHDVGSGTMATLVGFALSRTFSGAARTAQAAKASAIAITSLLIVPAVLSNECLR